MFNEIVFFCYNFSDVSDWTPLKTNFPLIDGSFILIDGFVNIRELHQKYGHLLDYAIREDTSAEVYADFRLIE